MCICIYIYIYAYVWHVYIYIYIYIYMAFTTERLFELVKYTSITWVKCTCILPLLSKVYERFICNQLLEYSNNFLNEILCGFCKAHSTQHPLFKLLQSCKKSLDCGAFIWKILRDLSKAYACISHKLLIAKLRYYGVNNTSLKLFLDYLTNRKQRTKIELSFGSWRDIDTGVAQGSILGLLSFS